MGIRRQFRGLRAHWKPLSVNQQKLQNLPHDHAGSEWPGQSGPLQYVGSLINAVRNHGEDVAILTHDLEPAGPGGLVPFLYRGPL